MAANFLERNQTDQPIHHLRSLPNLLVHYVTLLRLVGLYHYSAEDHVQPRIPKSCLRWFLRHKWCIYALLIMAYVITCVIKSLLMTYHYWMEGSFAISNVVNVFKFSSIIAWALREVMMVIVMFAASCCSSGFHSLYQLWEELRLFQCEKLEIEASIKHYSWFAAVISVVLLAADFIVLAIHCQSETSILHQSNLFVENMVHNFCFSTFLLLCFVIAKVLSVLTNRACSHYRNYNSAKYMQFTNFYNNYFVVVSIVQVVNAMFNLLLGTFVLSYLVQLLLRTFSRVNPEEEMPFAFFYWFGFQFVALLTIVWMASVVHEKAHACDIILYKLPIESLTPYEQLKMLELQHFLGGTNVYFTLFHFQPIRKSLLLTITSIFATYLFLLIQFPHNGS